MFKNETQRWRSWRRCSEHDVARLPLTADTLEPYCPPCCVLFSDFDSALTAPRAPGHLPWQCDGCGDGYADEEVQGATAAGRGEALRLAVGQTVGGSVMPITCGPVRLLTTSGAVRPHDTLNRLDDRR